MFRITLYNVVEGFYGPCLYVGRIHLLRTTFFLLPRSNPSLHHGVAGICRIVFPCPAYLFTMRWSG
jgi:hypothetical protein